MKTGESLSIYLSNRKAIQTYSQMQKHYDEKKLKILHRNNPNLLNLFSYPKRADMKMI